MGRLIYACRFEIPTQTKLQPVLEAYQNWITEHYRSRRDIKNFECDLTTDTPNKIIPPKHTLQVEHFSDEDSQAVRIQWAYPADLDEGLEWRNEVRAGAFGPRCSIEHLISINSVDYRIKPAHFVLGSPGVIRKLCSDTVMHIGDMNVKATPYSLSKNNVKDFLKLLTSPLRRLPIVFVSPYANGDANELDITAMAQHLTGVAIVVRALDVDATLEISEGVGRSLSCFNGGARIYWPGFSKNDEQKHHPLFLGTRIEALGAQAVSRRIENWIFAVSAFRFVPDSRINELIRNAEQAYRTQRMEAERASSGTDWETYALEIDAKLSETLQKIDDLQSENENLRANQKIYLASREFEEADDDPPEDNFVSETVFDAVNHAKRVFENLLVLNSALEAAQKSPFKRPTEISDALKDLDNIALDWAEQRRKRGNGGDLLHHLKARGWGKRCSMHISVTTKSRYQSHYEFEYGDKRVLFEPHITIGAGDANSCASIHFILDEACQKIVIAHVGRHLPNTKT